MIVSIIVAAATNNAIGKDNQLIWHLSDDLKFFKRTTSGHHIIMGRKTYESMGRALPNRTNIVITRNTNYTLPDALVTHSLADALKLVKNDENPFITGGAEIYKQALDQNLVDVIYLTRVHASPEGDTFFPEFNTEQFTLQSIEHHPVDEKHKFAFDIEKWVK